MEKFRNVSLSRVPMRKGAAIVRGLRTLENDIRNKVVCFCEEITGKNTKNRKTVLGSRHGEYGLYISETKNDRKQRHYQSCFFKLRDYGKKGHNHERTSFEHR